MANGTITTYQRPKNFGNCFEFIFFQFSPRRCRWGVKLKVSVSYSVIVFSLRRKKKFSTQSFGPAGADLQSVPLYTPIINRREQVILIKNIFTPEPILPLNCYSNIWAWLPEAMQIIIKSFSFCCHTKR